MVSLRRVEDGSLILRRPFVPDLVNKPLINHPLQQQLDAGVRSGTLRMRATVDGVERIYGFRRVGDYPLVIIAGLASSDYLAEWRAGLLAGRIVGCLCCWPGAGLGPRLACRARETEVACRLYAIARPARTLAENSHDVI